MYSGDPQNESEKSFVVKFSQDNPKSEIFMCPSISTSTFSG